MPKSQSKYVNLIAFLQRSISKEHVLNMSYGITRLYTTVYGCLTSGTTICPEILILRI